MLVKKNLRLWVSLVLVLGILLAACSSVAATETIDIEMDMEEGEMDHEDMEEGEHDHEDEVVRIPNDGGVILILSPEDGVTFAEGEGISVEVSVANFDLGEDGSHWHVYVDGESWGMITGGDTSHVLQGIEPGEHLVEVYLALGTHEELEEGDSIMITVEGN